MDKHTPTPWERIGRSIYTRSADTIEIVHGVKGRVNGIDNRDVAIANAAYIVHCVNTHTALVEAARAALRQMRHVRDTLTNDDRYGDICTEDWLSTWDALKAALAEEGGAREQQICHKRNAHTALVEAAKACVENCTSALECGDRGDWQAAEIYINNQRGIAEVALAVEGGADPDDDEEGE